LKVEGGREKRDPSTSVGMTLILSLRAARRVLRLEYIVKIRPFTFVQGDS
jgi:hypothetical protein